MAVARVLIISSHPIFAEALAHLAQEAGCEVMARATDLQQALPLLRTNTPVTIIVDHADAQLREAEWLPLLRQEDAVRRVILLTLTNNEMIVHEQSRVTQATIAELMSALRGSNTLPSSN